MTFPAGRWVLVAFYFLATSLSHLAVGLWLVKAREWGGTAFTFAQFVPWVSAVAGGVLLMWIAASVRRAGRPGILLAYWGLWATAVLMIDRWLTFTANEYAHYPQYALLAWLLGRALDPRRVRLIPARLLFWGTLLGMLDELMQYLWVAAAYEHHIDFNDFITNLVAVAGGVLIYYGPVPRWSQRGPERLPLLECGTVAALALGVFVGFASGRVVLNPPSEVPPGGWLASADGEARLYLQRRPAAFDSWNAGQRRPRYRVLGPLPGLLLLAGGGLLFGSLGHAMSRFPRRDPVRPAPLPAHN